jgi:hypothetical protein
MAFGEPQRNPSNQGDNSKRAFNTVGGFIFEGRHTICMNIREAVTQLEENLGMEHSEAAEEAGRTVATLQD